ncbi:MAG: glycoside hydrolase family 20 protein [Alloprevotella sp.]|nr:glycoside hydrolase family 20 protein [Alloprevotella sp.]
MQAQVNEKPFVTPELTSWQGAEGRVVPSGRVILKGNVKVLGPVVDRFVEDYHALTGQELTIAKGKAKAGDFVFAVNKQVKGEETYKLQIGQQIQVEASALRGLAWGAQTLLQLTEQSADRSLPRGIAEDKPRYELRGFMLDCGRKYIPMAYLRNLVKVMSYYKMNTLQIHLNDNGFKKYFDEDWNKTQAAFRLECDTYPGLTAKDGSYTKAEFIALQQLADSCGVEIIPEIDVPAHSLAFTQYKPEIGSKEYGMDHLDLFNPETMKFVDGLFKEYLEGKNPVFRGKRVHIGTDEYSNAKKEVVEKFRAFTDHYIRLVESYGKQAVCWGALTHANGDTPVKSENVIMDIWYNGYANPVEMKKQGYKLVSIPDGYVYIVPAAGYYYDYLNCQYLYEHWSPAQVGGVKFEDDDPAIIGGMFAVWNDHAGNGITVKDIHHRVFPAMQTLAVKCWNANKVSLPYAEFNKRRTALSEAPTVNELGRYGKGRQEILAQAEVKPGSTLEIPEVGYGYTVKFDLTLNADAKKGDVLFESDHAKVYLADPQTGRLAFEREGYLNQFNYRVPKGEKVNLSFEGDNKATVLYVNGHHRETLGELTVYVVKPSDKVNFQVEKAYASTPVIYQPKDQMHYQRTLVFPLAKAGQFNGTITNLKVLNYKEH